MKKLVLSVTNDRLQPQCFCHKLVIWKDLGHEQSIKLKKAPTLNRVKDILAEIFKLNSDPPDPKEEILLNLYTYTIQFARDEHFRAEQLSTYFSIIKQVHEVCTKSPFGNLDGTFTYFKDLLICHSVCHSKSSIEFFSTEEVRKISYHVINTYFRHFKLYKYVFTPKMWLDLTLHYVGETDSEISQDQDTEISLEKDEQVASGTEDSQEAVLSGIHEKEKAMKYLKKLITGFLQDKIDELKFSIEEKLKESEQLLNNKLEDVGFIKKSKKYIKKLKKESYNLQEK